MLAYKTPSQNSFHKRKQFHALQKDETESISDWFKHLQVFITKCEFDSMSDYMLIDKFVSGLNEMDFEKISKVASWTLQDLILVVIGNGHIFSTKQTKEKKQSPNDIASVHIKSENELQLSDTEHDSNDHLYDSLNEAEITGDSKTNNAKLNASNNSSAEMSTKERIRQSKIIRNKRYYQKLIEEGRYDDYRMKRALHAKQRRLQRKETEQYLPPDLRLHLMNERRRASRERVKRYRDRKSQKPIDKTNIKSRTKSKRKSPPKLAFVSEPQPSEHESDFQFEPDYLDHDIDIDLEPKLELELNETDSEPQPNLKRTNRKRAATKKPTKIQQVKKSAYQRKRTFECYLCSLACSKLYELKAHVAIFHPVEEIKKDLLNCPYCSKTTISRAILSRHLKKSHGSLQVHKCPCCNEQFKMRGQLTEHMSQHPEYRPFICETCARSFRTLSELNTHQRRHTEQTQVRCEVCGFQLASRKSLKGHMMIHTGERPYPCTMCEKEFRQVSSLRKHLLSVHKQGEKRFVCKTCAKRFASIYHLRIHENIHTGARPYQCDHCGSDFNQPSALKTHINRIHGKAISAEKTVSIGAIITDAHTV